MDKIVIRSEMVIHNEVSYVLTMCVEEGTDNYSVELWEGLNLLGGHDYLLENEADELMETIRRDIAEYV